MNTMSIRFSTGAASGINDFARSEPILDNFCTLLYYRLLRFRHASSAFPPRMYAWVEKEFSAEQWLGLPINDSLSSRASICFLV